MLHRETNVSGFAKSVERQTRKLSGSGGKGIRTPGLLIANETLYQLSYTPVVIELRLARAADFSSTETTYVASDYEVNHGISALLSVSGSTPKLPDKSYSARRGGCDNTSDAKEQLQRARSCLRCALQFSICFA